MTTEMAVAPKDLRGLLGTPAVRTQFESILGKKAQAFASSIITVTQGNKALQECAPQSIIASAAIAASLDLPIIASLGQSCIVPYDGKATFQIMTRGYVQLALRSGLYKTMNAVEVHEGELVSRNRLTGEIDFNPDGKKSEKIIGFLFYFKLLSGYEKYTYMTVEEAHAHGKRYSKSYSNTKGMWQTNFNAQALKTVVKQGLSKWGPLSTEMQTAIQYDQAAVTPEGKPDYIDSTAEAASDEPAKPIPGPEEAPVKEVGSNNVKIQGVMRCGKNYKIKGELDYFITEEKEVLALSAKKLFEAGEEARITWEKDAFGKYWATDIDRVSSKF